MSTEKQLAALAKKHPHHIVVGAFKRLYNGELYKEFQNAANTLSTVKFVDFTDLEYF